MRRLAFLSLLAACSTEQTDPPPRISAPARDAGVTEGGVTPNDGGLDQDGDTTVNVGDAGNDTGPPPRVDDASCTANPPPAPANGLTLIAYGLSGFTDTQGKCGFRYGYVAPATSPAFLDMMQYDGAWHVQDGTYWTYMNGITMHPNGTTTSGGRLPVEHWAVRRWISNVNALVHIAGVVKKAAGAGGLGNGTIARIVVGGTNKIFEHTITDETGMTFDVTATLAIDTTIDFVIDPNMGDDGTDSTDFDVRVWR